MATGLVWLRVRIFGEEISTPSYWRQEIFIRFRSQSNRQDRKGCSNWRMSPQTQTFQTFRPILVESSLHPGRWRFPLSVVEIAIKENHLFELLHRSNIFCWKLGQQSKSLCFGILVCVRFSIFLFYDKKNGLRLTTFLSPITYFMYMIKSVTQYMSSMSGQCLILEIPSFIHHLY